MRRTDMLIISVFEKGFLFKVKRALIVIRNNCFKTRITKFIKAMLKKSDDQTNIDKYRVVANIMIIILCKKF